MKNIRQILPPVGYLLISLLATWPLVIHLQGWVPGQGDWGQNMWALWWTRQALVSVGQSPFFTHHFFYPEGVTLLFHPIDISDGLLAIPLYGLFGGDVTYNLMILLSFVLGGWGSYLLAYYLTGQRGPSFVAGLVFVLSPYHFQRIDLGHLNLSTIQWLPFYTLFLLKYVQQGSHRSGVLAVFFLVFNALNSWYYVVYCGLLGVAIILWPSQLKARAGLRPHPVSPPARAGLRPRPLAFSWQSSLQRASRIALVLVGALLILSPLLIPMLRLLGSTTLVGSHDPLRHSADLFSFWLPGPPSTWAAWFEEGWISYAAHNREPGASPYFGYVVLGLGGVGLLKFWRQGLVLWWGGLALGFTLLGMGPQLQVDGQILQMPLPYGLLSQTIPIFSLTGIPGRFVVMTSLALAVLSGYGLAALLAWLEGRAAVDFLNLSIITCTLVGGLIMIEYSAIPLRLSSTEKSEFYTRLAADPEAYAILDIKWDANFLMHAQTIHGKPLVGGWLARLPTDQAAYLEQPGLDKAFLYLLLGPEGLQISDQAAIPPAIQAALAEREVRYIIDHDNLAGPFLGQLLAWPVVFEAEGVVVYERVVKVVK